MISFPRAIILWPFMIINSVSPLRFVFSQQDWRGFCFFSLSFSRHSRTLCMHFIGVLWVFRPVFLSCFIAVMQMRVCKDRMALGLYL